MIGKPVNFIDGEIWKPIPHRDVPGKQFYASNLGRIKKVYLTKKNVTKEHLIQPQPCSDGKIKVSLWLTKNVHDRASTYVCKLVLMSFQPCTNMDKLLILHLDHDNANCRLDNLKWCTTKEYYTHIGKDPQYPRNNVSKYIDSATGEIRTKFHKISTATIRNIIADYNSGMKQIDIAQKNGVTQPYISKLLSGNRRNLNTDIIPARYSRDKKRSRLKDPDVMEKPIRDHDKGKDT